MARIFAACVIGLALGSAACSEKQPSDEGQVVAGAAGTGAPAAGSSGAGAGGMTGATGGTTGMSGTGGTTPVVDPMMGTAGTMMEEPLAGTGAAGEEPVLPTGDFDYEAETVTLDADLVIASGEMLRVGPGTTFNAATGVTVRVEGMLLVEGSAEAPVKFLGAGMPRSWAGIVIVSGGYASISHAEIGGATFGIHAQVGSDFDVAYSDIGTSFKVAVVESDGTFDHVKFHASGDPTFSPVNEVSSNDVNGTLTILSASPTITHSSFDGSATLVDMVRVGGDASPVFDHVRMQDAHCGIHANGGVNSRPIIRNSVFERHAYALMVYATKPLIEDSVFIGNANDIGFCFEAVADNAPTLERNFYSSGAAIIDPTCFQIGTVATNSAASANPEAGPMGL